MTFQVVALDPAEFTALFDLDDAALAATGGRHITATATPGFPCRISLEDANPGNALILVNYTYLAGATPMPPATPSMSARAPYRPGPCRASFPKCSRAACCRSAPMITRSRL